MNKPTNECQIKKNGEETLASKQNYQVKLRRKQKEQAIE